MAKLTKFEKEVMSAEHKYFKVKTDLYGYKIMLKTSGVKKCNESIKNWGWLSGPLHTLGFYELPVADFVMVKYRIPKGADIYVSENDPNGWKKCRASEVEIVELREIIEDEKDGEIHTGKQYNGYGYSTYIVNEAYIHKKNLMRICSYPHTYGRCKKGQKFLMKKFFHLTPNEVFEKLFGEQTDPFYRSLYDNMPVRSKLTRCRIKATCNTGFHFFMEETEAINYLLYAILLRG